MKFNLTKMILKPIKRLGLLIIILLINASLFAQNIIVSGTVNDLSTGIPLPGANVIIKGTSSGTVTDVNGNYSIEVTDPNSILVFSFIGYEEKEIQVNGQTFIKVDLPLNAQDLDEVVVIGYGVQTKKLITGATSQVKGEELEKQNTTNALQALQGQAAGINITSESGQPGEGFKVNIRGLGTIGNSKPLFIVDGVQTDDIKFLNNADIESIDVLKDAASAAIYGARAANGVVLITTKTGSAEKSQITFDAYYGVQNLAKKIDFLDAEQYAEIIYEAHQNSGGTLNSMPFDPFDLPAYTKAGVANTDWLNEMFVDNAVTQNYSIGATGGSETSIYSFSLSYTGQEGIIGGKDNSNFDRYNGRFNSENKLYNDKIKVGEHLLYSYNKKTGIQVGGQYSNTLRGALNTSPLRPIYDDNGEFFDAANLDLIDQNGNSYWLDTEGNPYASMVIDNNNISNSTKLIGDVYADIEILKNLKFRSSLGLDYNNSDYRSYSPIYELSVYSQRVYSSVMQNMDKKLTLNLDNVLKYDIFKGLHTINAMVGNTIYQYKGSKIEGENADVAFNDLEHAYLNNATNAEDWARIRLQGYPYDENKLLSYFGRVQYNYNETYLLNFTMRADGSSNFAEGHRWGYFPSVSAGIVLSNMDFMVSTEEFLDFFKVRLSWGQNGNASIDAYQYVAPISFTNATYAFGNVEGVVTNGAFPSRLVNEKIKWETSEQSNFGFDSRLLNNKLSLIFDWYKKSTKDWLVSAPIYATSGADAPYINGGNVINSGVELSVNYSNNNAGDFNYSIGINVAYNKNEVQNIPTDDSLIHGSTNVLYANSLEFYRAEAGHPIGYFWGWETAGIFQDTNEIANYTSSDGTVIQPRAEPGDLKYVDQNNDGTIDHDDKVDIGDPNPDFVYGFSFSCNYKAIDFNILANGVAGNQIVQSYRNQGRYDNYTTEILDRWHGPGTSNTIPRVTTSNNNYQFSEIFIKDGSYIRISNITLGYDVAQKVNIKNFSQCRIYASVQNLYTFTKYTGMDPEVGFGVYDYDNPADRFSSGIDVGFYPRPRTVLFGINLKF